MVAAAERRIASAIGWSVFAGEGDAALFTSSVKSALEAADTHVKLRLKELERKAGKVGKRGRGGRVNFYQTRKEALERTAPRWKFTKDPAGYPKGAGLFEVTFGFDNGDVRNIVELDEMELPTETPAKRTFVLGKVPVKLVVVPGEAGRVVWGVSVDGETLRDKLLGTLAGADKTYTLTGRTGLEALTPKLVAGGFMYVGPTLARLMTLDPQDNDVEELRDALDAMPNKAGGRAIFAITGQEGDAPSVNFTTTMDELLTKDLLSLLRPD